MKYLIITKPRNTMIPDKATAAHLKEAKKKLQAGMDKGIVEGCYALVSGGSVWVVNARSHGSLARALRKFGLTLVHDIEVHPIVDGHAVLDAHIDHRGG